MNKAEREKLLAESYFKYIKTLDRDSTTNFYKKLGIVGAILAFLITADLINLNQLNETGILTLFSVGAVYFLYFINMSNQYVKYVDDSYEDLLVAIRNNKILSYKMKERTWLERSLWYKKKHKG